MKSPKELNINQKILKLLEHLCYLPEINEDLPLKIFHLLEQDEEIQAMQDYANTVAIKRLGYNDHGPVHMRKVAFNAITMLQILFESGIRTSLETEQSGTFSDSLSAVLFSGFMHDFGMTIGRQDHELYSSYLALPLITRILDQVLPEKKDIRRKVVVRSMAVEGIVGHMGTHKIHSLEAGLIQIADGCDMTKGRARIPMVMNTEARAGDIHKYSADSIEEVHISKGQDKPIRIDVTMNERVGFFQIEEVLLQKINASPAKHLVELYAGLVDQDMKKYL